MRTIEEKKDMELFSSCQFLKSILSSDRCCRIAYDTSGVTVAGRKVLIMQAGQEGPILFFSLSSFSTSMTGRCADFQC